jgi:hypothetical protein
MTPAGYVFWGNNSIQLAQEFQLIAKYTEGTILYLIQIQYSVFTAYL